MRPDRRVRRTRESLWRSLVELTLEKGYGRVTVQDILDRADVGRSTFYTHFQGKDDLLVSGFEELRAEMAAAARNSPDDVLSPMRAVFRHIDERRELFRATAGKYEPALLVVHRGLTEALADHLRTQLRTDDFDAAVAFVVNGMTGLVHWWLDTGAPLSADEVYERFRRFAMHGLEPLLA